jgi:hypothetical protein
MKWVLRLAVVAVLVLLLLGLAVYFYADRIATRAVERGGEYATGVRTSVGSVSLGLFRGEAGLRSLQMDNPVGMGFDTPYFLKLDDARTTVNFGSLRQDVIVVPLVHLDGMQLNLEHKGGQKNYQVILDNLQRLSDGEKPEAEDGREWVISELRLTDLDVTAKVGGVAAESQTVRFQIPEIVLDDVRSGSMAELQGQVVKQVLAVVIRQAATQLPGVMVAELTAGINRVGSLGQATLDRVGDVRGLVGGVGEGAERMLQDAGGVAGEAADRARESAGRAMEGVQRGVGGLLGGNRTPVPADEDDAQPE